MFGQDNGNDNQDHNQNPQSAGAPPQDSGGSNEHDAAGPSTAAGSVPVNTISPSFMPAPPAAAPAVAPVQNDLLDIKQQALQNLSPLVGQLDQSPEEKFRTTMMMIQASDDQNLVKDAYESAKQIPDEKARAQALLDVINEINYFTQQKK